MIFESIAANLPTEGASLVNAIKGNVQFIVTSPTGEPLKYHIALSSEPATCEETEKPADLTVSVCAFPFAFVCP